MEVHIKKSRFTESQIVAVPKEAETDVPVNEVCRKLGVSRTHYYDIRKTIEEEGLQGLLEKSRKAPRIGNRVAPEIEQKVLDYSLEFPTQGQVRVSNELKKQDFRVSAGGIRSIWLRHKIETKAQRLKRLEKWAADNLGILTESQIQALEAAKQEAEVHGEIESPHPAFLVAQDTCYIGHIKGIGWLYQQTGIDTHANIGFAKVYTDRTSLTAADFLNDKVLPFYDEHGISILQILTDRGPEYCGRTETHSYEQFLHLNGIEHTKTKPRHPQTNGCVERLNQTVQEEFYKVAIRKKLYKTIEEVQTDLGAFMAWYNSERTPMQTFLDGMELYQKYVYENPVEEKEAMM